MSNLATEPQAADQAAEASPATETPLMPIAAEVPPAVEGAPPDARAALRSALAEKHGVCLQLQTLLETLQTEKATLLELEQQVEDAGKAIATARAADGEALAAAAVRGGKKAAKIGRTRAAKELLSELEDAKEIQIAAVARITEEIQTLDQVLLAAEVKVLAARSALIAPIAQEAVDRFLVAYYEQVRLAAIMRTLLEEESPEGIERWARGQYTALKQIGAPLQAAKAAASNATVQNPQRAEKTFEVAKAAGEETRAALDAMLGDENAPLPEI